MMRCNYIYIYLNFQSKVMNFHQLEVRCILQDQKDNESLSKLLTIFQQLKKKYGDAQEQIASLNTQVSRLKQTNKSLEQEMKRRNHSYSVKQQPLFVKDISNCMSFSKTSNSYFHVQQTKRKVINGFVAQLTSQLQNSEQLLFKERKMHEDMRRSLQACNEEILSLKAKNRAYQNEINNIMGQSRQLLNELSETQAKKDDLEVQLKHKYVQMNCHQTSLFRRSQQAQQEFLLMDKIYRQIQLELQMK